MVEMVAVLCSALPAAEEQSLGAEGAAGAPVCSPADAGRLHRLHQETHPRAAPIGAE